MNEKLLQTAGRDRERIPAAGKSGGFLSLHQLEDGKLNLDDQAYCVRFAEPKEWAKLRKEVEARRDTLPSHSYWQCLNPSCRWAAKMGGEKKEPVACLKCNSQGWKEKSFMKRMDKKEAEAFDKAESERAVREIEQLTLMEFNRQNEDRAKIGLPALTREQFDKNRAAEYQLEQERRAQLSKAKP